LRSAVLVVLTVAFAIVPSASAVQIGSTDCSLDVRARSGNLECTLATAGGGLSLGGSPSITTAVSDGEAAALGYDAFGRLVRADVGGRTTSYMYDEAGRLSAIVDPGGETTSYEYDSIDRVVAAGDSRFVYSDQGLVRATGDQGDIVEYTYDSVSNLLSINQGESRGRFAYDAHRRVTLVETTAVRTEYDYVGRQLVRRVQNGDVTEYSYDQQGRLVHSSGPRGQVVDYDYDSDGSLLHVSTAGGVTSFSYDRAERLTAIVGADGGATEFAYDDSGLLAAVVPAAGDEVLINFEQGDPNEPVTLGMLWSDGDGSSVSVTPLGRLRTCSSCP
jgi:YD repeat-containing protein